MLNTSDFNTSKLAYPMSAAETFHGIANLWRAARWTKNLPLLFLLAGGVLLSSHAPPWQVLAVCVGTVLTSSAFMTHLNNLTDRELDKVKKPELYRWMSAHPKLTILVMSLEAGLTLAGISWLLGAGYWLSGLSLAVYFWLTVQYSYNTLQLSNPAGTRWKCSITGHFVVLVSGYSALWIAGAGLAPLETILVPNWILLVLLVSLSEYSLFLGESAIDAAEEHAAGVGTMSARFGARRTSFVALGLSLVSVLGLGALMAIPGQQVSLLLFAFLPAFALRLGVLAVLTKTRSLSQDHTLRSVLPDLIFYGARVSTVVSLLVLTR